MKKIFSVLLLLTCVCTSVIAKEIKTVCANHILVSTEGEAIKIKSQIKSFDDFKYYARIFQAALQEETVEI